MQKEKKFYNYRFGISVTRKVLDGDSFYNVRVPMGAKKEVCIEADNSVEACKIAELIEHGGMVTIEEAL